MVIQFIVIGFVVVLAIRGIVKGLTMKEIELPSLPTGTPEGYRSAPAQWYHRLFYITVSAGALGLVAYYVFAIKGWPHVGR